MNRTQWATEVPLALVVSLCLTFAFGRGNGADGEDKAAEDIVKGAGSMLTEGRATFRHDTFGDEDFWGRQLGLHLAIAGERLGGVGPGLAPEDALALGLKVDGQSLSAGTLARFKAGALDLTDPANTVELLRTDSVVGVEGFFDERGGLTSVGITCALCHSTVDDSIAPGIGLRLDGWANRDLDVGAVVALAPDLSPFAELLELPESSVRDVFLSWGPGKFDASLALDGKAFQPDGTSAAVLIPPAFGLAGVNLHTWTGWGSVSHWNALVAVLEMHGQGTFQDARLADATRFPVAAKAGFDDVHADTDLVTSKLPALHAYQLALAAPAPPVGSFEPAAAARGDALFEGAAKCATCHVAPLFTEPGWNLHRPEELGIDAFQAERGPEGAYRTTPLRGLWTHQKGGFFHDGRFATLDEVVAHYDAHFKLGLTAQQQSDLVQYLLSL